MSFVRDIIVRQPDVTSAVRKVVASGDPAANAEFSVTVPTGVRYELLAVSVNLVQGLTQTPWPSLIIDDGTNTLFQGLGASSAQNSSVTTQYTWAPGLTLTAGAANTVANAPLPRGLVLPAGYRVRSSTSGLGANSNYGVAQLFIVEYTL